MSQTVKTHKLAVTAILSAAAAILMFLSFPMPFLIPSFVKMDFSELPALLAAFSLGPVSGVAVCLVKNVINVFFSTTGGVGELCNFLLGVCLVVPAGLIYRARRTRGGALAGALLGSAAMNFGSIANVGFELSTDVDIIRSRNWLWNVGINLTTLKNTILELPDQYAKDGQISGTKKYMVGHGIYDFWMYKYQGIDLSDGHSLFAFNSDDYYIQDSNLSGNGPETQPTTPNGDEKTLAEEGYRIINGKVYATNTTYAKKDWSGSAIPDAFGSLSTLLKWKNFTLSALMTWQIGGLILDYSYSGMMGTTTNPGALHVDNLKAWTPENKGEGISTAYYPALNTSDNSYNYATSDFFLIDASYFVLKNITLSYDLPRNVVEKMKLSGLAISVSCDNAVTLTKRQGMNPQQSFNGLNYNAYVPARVFAVGLNLKF